MTLIFWKDFILFRKWDLMTPDVRMLMPPLVRIDAIEAARIIAIANDWLKSESWELYTK